MGLFRNHDGHMITHHLQSKYTSGQTAIYPTGMP